MTYYMLRSDITVELLERRGWSQQEIEVFNEEYQKEREIRWNEERKAL